MTLKSFGFDFDETPQATDQPFDQIACDRRADRRYELRLELKWKLIRRRRVLDSGEGKTLDLSSGGIRFDAGKPLPAGLNVELAVLWPVLLHNVAPLQLVITGRITRSDQNQIAVRIAQHEFRTAATSAATRQIPAVARMSAGAGAGFPGTSLKVQ